MQATISVIRLRSSVEFQMWFIIGLAIGLVIGLIFGVFVGFSLFKRAGTWD
jgi:hypothetical protein